MVFMDSRFEGKFAGKESIEDALKRLNERLVYAEIEPLSLVICGGASLNIMGYVSRSTSDVDILAVVTKGLGQQIELMSGEALPWKFDELVEEVGRELGLAGDWLNFGPEPLLKFGLPAGLKDRMKEIKYGDCLTIHAISRWDQIHLKCHAALDPGSRIETHLGDLLELEPTEEEAKASVNWLLDRPAGEEFRERVKQLMERIGHEELAKTI